MDTVSATLTGLDAGRRLAGSRDSWFGLWAGKFKAPGSLTVPGALMALEALPRRYAAMDRMVQAPRSSVNRKRGRAGYGRWFKHDSALRCHPKILQAGPLGELLYLHAIEYANQYLTDGFIPNRVLGTLVTWNGDMAVDPVTLAGKLVEAGLFDPVPGGFRVHDFLHFSTPKRDVIRIGQARSDSGQMGGGSIKRSLANKIEQAKRTANSKQTPSKVQAELDRELEEEKEVGSREVLSSSEIYSTPSLLQLSSPSGDTRASWRAAFDQLWKQHLPRKGRKANKGKALEVWMRKWTTVKDPPRPQAEFVLSQHLANCQSREWCEDGYVPDLFRWIEGEGWTGEVGPDASADPAAGVHKWLKKNNEGVT